MAANHTSGPKFTNTTILRQFWTCDDLTTIVEFTKHLWQS